MMNKIREWTFPVGVLVAWMVVASYTMSQLTKLPRVAEAPATRSASV